MSGEGGSSSASPRARRTTMKDVAALARVSPQTVSNYVNGRHDEMGDATMRRVAEAIDLLSYRPNIAAASLRSMRSKTLAFLVLDTHDAFLADPLTDLLIAGVGDVARDHGYGVLIRGARPDRGHDELLGALREGRVDGAVVLLSGAPKVRREYVDAGLATGKHLVVLDEMSLPSPAMGVRADQRVGAMRLTAHLLDAGHRRIAFIGAAVPWAVVEQRVAGFRAAHKARNVTVDRDLVVLEAQYRAQGGEQLATSLLRREHPPTAIVCGSDLLAAGAMRGAKSLGLKIPSDVAVAGFDDFEFSEYLDPPLTTVHVPAYQMGRQAATMLIDRVEGRETEHRCVFPTDVVLRAST